jgi:hypothetical protein
VKSGLSLRTERREDVAEYNREAQAHVFNIFGWLAEAARG